MVLHIRHNPQSYISVNSIQDLRDIIGNYIPGRPLVLGNYVTFGKQMRYMLLKFLEENPEVDVYSSEDVDDPILLSRFVKVEKEPLSYGRVQDVDGYKKSNHDFMSADTLLLGLSGPDKMLVHGAPDQMLDLLLSAV